MSGDSSLSNAEDPQRRPVSLVSVSAIDVMPVSISRYSVGPDRDRRRLSDPWSAPSGLPDWPLNRQDDVIRR
jgi:hypothetical protein